MADEPRRVTGGVDTHKDIHVAAVLDDVGRTLGTEGFCTTPAGYRDLTRWMRSFGELDQVGVEGTGSYGAGLARHLASSGIEVREVIRPNRQARRLKGKNDTVDAIAAARAAMNGEATATPKTNDGVVESIRALRVAFCSSRTSRTRISNQIRDLVATAPEALRQQLQPLSTEARVERCARLRPGALTDPAEATKASLRCLARQHQALSEDLEELRGQIDALTEQANPSLRAAKGVGTDVAAILLVAAGDNPERLTSESAFAALCGVSPVEASSGRIVRHRLNQGGNRQANHALWRIAFVRLSTDPTTKTYAAKRRAEGKTNREILRCLKRYIAREIYLHLVNPQPIADNSDLRPLRNGAHISLETAAKHFGVWPTRLSRIERNLDRHDPLISDYRAWLQRPDLLDAI